ncbi:MAG: primosomal protein N' [Clostridiales bacterium]|nr:primosomal protein N' [Clostridiales bacterium]
MKFANVIVDISHQRVDQTFQYRIPEELQGKVKVGMPVLVPFGGGGRKVKGFLVELTNVPEFDEERLKDIEMVEEKGNVIEDQLIQLASWMKETYGCTMIQALKTVLPSKRRVKSRKARVSQTSLPEDEEWHPEPAPSLNEEQSRAVEGIWQEIHGEKPRPCLLFGVTGSGKTEVYMELISRMAAEGRQSILLIPEISLTYQNLQRFYRRFGRRVAVVNSRLSEGEKFDSMEKARKGEVDLIIGPRSALFAPFPRLGLILVDEEHETAYNSETSPRYHGVETAIARAGLANAGIVLGSATPSMESFDAAMDRRYAVFPLRKRARSGSVLPQVDVVDMREELREGNKSIFSGTLAQSIRERLEKKEQIILFLNRRGYAGFISCRSCGTVMKCPHCDVSLTSHRGGRLVCHYCGYERPMPDRCPSCGSPYIAGFGIGTQKVEAMISREFPEARVLRMDLDTTGKKDSHSRILSAFAGGEADILLGTQMIVKGHDFPKVTLVGILAADLSLYSSDFRSAERTFQLLTQAAGRAGRAGSRGNVVIQTYNPENYAVSLAAKQDYITFYKQEIQYRKMMGYPPAGEMMSLLITSPQEETAEEFAQRLVRDIRREFIREAPVLIGPADAGIAKIQDLYRKRIYVKHGDRQVLLDIRDFAVRFTGCELQIDIL